jgi:hypothetical protein
MSAFLAPVFVPVPVCYRYVGRDRLVVRHSEPCDHLTQHRHAHSRKRRLINCCTYTCSSCLFLHFFNSFHPSCCFVLSFSVGTQSVYMCFVIGCVCACVTSARHVWLYEFVIRAVRKKLHWVLTAENLVARNADEAVAGPRLAGVWNQAVVLCWCVWQEPVFCSREDVFTCNFLCREIV